MKHEISQLDISDRQLLKSNAPVSTWTEIGEAQITHTIFGRAKVRIIRKHDNIRHAFYWLVAIVAVAIGATVWQGWFTHRESEPLQSADSISSDSAKMLEREPALQPEHIAPPAIAPVVKSEPGTPPQAEISKPETIQKSASQTAPSMKAAENLAAKPIMAQPKPVAVQPPAVIKPQSAPLATNEAVAKSPADKSLPPRLLPPRQPATTPSAVTPRATPHATPSAASSPVAATLPVMPLVKESISAPSQAGDKQLSDPVNTQNK